MLVLLWDDPLQNGPSEGFPQIVVAAQVSHLGERSSGGEVFYLQLEFFCLKLSFFAYSPLRRVLDALSHCKQAPTVSKKAKIVSAKAAIVSIKAKLKLSTVSKKAPL